MKRSLLLFCRIRLVFIKVDIHNYFVLGTSETIHEVFRYQLVHICNQPTSFLPFSSLTFLSLFSAGNSLKMFGNEKYAWFAGTKVDNFFFCYPFWRYLQSPIVQPHTVFISLDLMMIKVSIISAFSNLFSFDINIIYMCDPPSIVVYLLASLGWYKRFMYIGNDATNQEIFE